jgi:L-aspartate oxidase
MHHFNFLVIGGGIAGLSFALKVAPLGRVAVLFKRSPHDSNTAWAQGGIAAVTAKDDSSLLHFEDTAIAGAGLCNPAIVKIVVEEGPARVQELIEWGTKFDRSKDDDTGYDLHREGGHSRRRIYHATDKTGWEIQQTLLRQVRAHPNIELFPDSHAIDLITTHKLGLERTEQKRVLGAYVLFADGKVDALMADYVMVATGGAGKVYLYTSNPDIASGDGIAICYRAGVAVANMEFFQFHPTCLFHPAAKSFLITEALRGEGARLCRINGEYFMEKYHPLAELAPRDVVARAIDNEMKVHGEEHVLLDISFKPAEFIQSHFPTIYTRCRQYGYDMTKQAIPVVPAAHYCCGGVVCDQVGATNIKNLFVSGEVAHTGLHGANRLASNSLLEALVFSHRAAEFIGTHHTESFKQYEAPAWNPGAASASDEQVVVTQNWDEVRRFMWNYVGIVRSTKRLERALHRSELLEREILEYYWNSIVTPDLLELRNVSLVANIVIRSALQRKESRGLHFTIDYPHQDPRQCRDTVIYPAE